MNKILAILPARSGSKRVPGKNIKQLAGKPLLAWTIQAAEPVSQMELIVSTDDKIVAEVARNFGAKVPFIRDAEHATDTATVIEVVLEAIQHFENEGKHFDAVLLLQPTSPFRTASSIRRAIELYQRYDGDSVVSVSPAATHPYWCKRIEGDVLLPFDANFDDRVRSQDLPEVYQLNGSIYLSSVHNLKKNCSFYSDKTHALVLESEEEAIDIDTYFDWKVAEAFALDKGES